MDHHHSSLTTNLHFLHHQHIPKRHKHTPYSSSSEEFPASMSSVAIFRCVRVRSMDESVNEIAYQTSVNIGGHVFSGLLYDQGPHQPPPSNSIDPHHHHHHHADHLHSNTNNLNLMMMSNSSNNVPTIIDAPPLPHDQPFLSSSSTSFVRPPAMPYYFSHPPKP
nr:protein SHI RELATED SEQUENCE 3-like [Arachis hypogaea]